MNTSCNEIFFFGENTFPDALWLRSTIFQNVCEKLWGKLLKNLSRCQEDSVEQFGFRKFMYFNFCLTFSWKSFDSPKKLCLSNLQITCPDENVLDLVSLEKYFCICLKAPIKNSSEFRGIFCAWLSKLHLNSLEETTDKNCFW